MLGRVGYLGPRGGRLRESLQEFSEECMDLECDGREGPPAPRNLLDVVVVTDPRLKTLQSAVASLKTGGWLYAEVDRGWARSGPLRHLPRPSVRPRVTSMLRRLGMEDIAVSWHWPDFDASNAILGVRDRAAVLYALRFRPDTPGLRWASIAAHGILRSPLLGLVVPCVSVVARRGGAA